MIFITVVLFAVFYFYMFKGTLFGLSFNNNTFGGFLLAREVFVFIVLGVILFNIFGTEATNRYFFINDESIRFTEFYIFYALFVFTFVVGLLSKTVFKNYFVISKIGKHENSIIGSQKLLESVLFLLIFIFCLFYLFGMKHAFLSSYFTGGSLISYRLHNSYGTSVPSVIMSLYSFLIVMYAVCIGISSGYLTKNKIFIHIVFLLLFASFLGGKAPVVRSLILFFLAYVSVREFSFKKKIQFSIFSFICFFFILFFVVKAQFGELSIYRFFNFIYLRLGTGQVQGAYEQFALQLRNFEYIWHSLPFSELLTNVPRFNKDLMMSTYGENLSSRSDTGVMNSFFIGEAFAIGGIALVLISPVIVAVNYILIYFFSYKIFIKYFNIRICQSRLYIQLIIPSYIVLTGDFTGFLFGKLLFMVFVFFTFVFLMKKILNLLIPNRRILFSFY